MGGFLTHDGKATSNSQNKSMSNHVATEFISVMVVYMLYLVVTYSSSDLS